MKFRPGHDFLLLRERERGKETERERERQRETEEGERERGLDYYKSYTATACIALLAPPVWEAAELLLVTMVSATEVGSRPGHGIIWGAWCLSAHLGRTPSSRHILGVDNLRKSPGPQG